MSARARQIAIALVCETGEQALEALLVCKLSQPPSQMLEPVLAFDELVEEPERPLAIECVGPPRREHRNRPAEVLNLMTTVHARAA
jgi:hypothetical protein